MQTRLADFIRDTAAGQEADAILRTCVHCGFCTATCPTYQLLGDELDGPRGRIYQIKTVLEGEPATEKIRQHLDRCLLCRACETTCPSGVQYGRLLEIGRQVVQERLPRQGPGAWTRQVLRQVLPNPGLFRMAVGVGQALRPLLPDALADKLPAEARPDPGPWPEARHSRRMLVLAGCVQPALAPRINAAAARVLDRLGISLIEVSGCCGAVVQHLDDPEGARAQVRRNIDAWWPLVEAGAEALLVTASGCGVQVRDYGHLLQDDPAYRERAERLAALARDPLEVCGAAGDAFIALLAEARQERGRLAFHSPCTLQHGLRIRGVAESFLAALGYELVPVADGHLCCGSAGTYSVTQPELSGRLRQAKLAALSAGNPALVVTANIGCLTHLQAGSLLPVRHWIEVVDAALMEITN